MACEALPVDFRVTGLRVEDRKAAVYGDKIVLKRAIEENRMIAVLCDEEDNPYAIVEFIGEH